MLNLSDTRAESAYLLKKKKKGEIKGNEKHQVRYRPTFIRQMFPTFHWFQKGGALNSQGSLRSGLEAKTVYQPIT